MKKLIPLLLVGIFIGSTGTLAMNQLFSDVKSDQWYSEAISNLVEKDIIKGYPDKTFKPSEEVNRAELAVTLDRLLTYLENQEKADESENDGYQEYKSEDLGIKFKSGFFDEIIEVGNKIGNKSYPNQLEVFNKEKDTPIESAILNLISKSGKDASKCEVVRKNENINTMNAQYKIDLVDKNIVYTSEELERINEAEETDESIDGPEDGEWMKRKIYNEHLIEACTLYADPAGLGTSKSIGAHFEYNDYRSKDKFVFVNVQTGGEVHEENTLEFLMD